MLPMPRCSFTATMSTSMGTPAGRKRASASLTVAAAAAAPCTRACHNGCGAKWTRSNPRQLSKVASDHQLHQCPLRGVHSGSRRERSTAASSSAAPPAPAAAANDDNDLFVGGGGLVDDEFEPAAAAEVGVHDVASDEEQKEEAGEEQTFRSGYARSLERPTMQIRIFTDRALVIAVCSENT
jgi:hypothetical protein